LPGRDRRLAPETGPYGMLHIPTSQRPQEGQLFSNSFSHNQLRVCEELQHSFSYFNTPRFSVF
jgi:hypothetical protein